MFTKYLLITGISNIPQVTAGPLQKVQFCVTLCLLTFLSQTLQLMYLTHSRMHNVQDRQFRETNMGDDLNKVNRFLASRDYI